MWGANKHVLALLALFGAMTATGAYAVLPALATAYRAFEATVRAIHTIHDTVEAFRMLADFVRPDPRPNRVTQTTPVVSSERYSDVLARLNDVVTQLNEVNAAIVAVDVRVREGFEDAPQQRLYLGSYAFAYAFRQEEDTRVAGSRGAPVRNRGDGHSAHQEWNTRVRWHNYLLLVGEAEGQTGMTRPRFHYIRAVHTLTMSLEDMYALYDGPLDPETKAALEGAIKTLDGSLALASASDSTLANVRHNEWRAYRDALTAIAHDPRYAAIARDQRLPTNASSACFVRQVLQGSGAADRYEHRRFGYRIDFERAPRPAWSPADAMRGQAGPIVQAGALQPDDTPAAIAASGSRNAGCQLVTERELRGRPVVAHWNDVATSYNQAVERASVHAGRAALAGKALDLAHETRARLANLRAAINAEPLQPRTSQQETRCPPRSRLRGGTC